MRVEQMEANPRLPSRTASCMVSHGWYGHSIQDWSVKQTGLMLVAGPAVLGPFEHGAFRPVRASW